MPLCIAGMHRSGTSMIASLLHACGLDLGPKEDFLSPAPNNPEGFWESRSFLRLNDAILKELGGSWDRPPLMESVGWEDEPNLHHLCKQAGMLIDRFAGREPWGWKDPRNCLTLPLWRKMLPKLKVLICVRNPLAVAESLLLRDEIPYAASFDLWFTYNRRVLAAAPLESRLVTHCDSYLHDPRAELRRVVEWAGINTTEDKVDRACQRMVPSLMHHRMTLDDLADAGAADELLLCYRDLCEEAKRGEPAAFAAGSSTVA
ncbi:MAG: sulfotransferase family protein [Gemmataceae bacterium]